MTEDTAPRARWYPLLYGIRTPWHSHPPKGANAMEEKPRSRFLPCPGLDLGPLTLQFSTQPLDHGATQSVSIRFTHPTIHSSSFINPPSCPPTHPTLLRSVIQPRIPTIGPWKSDDHRKHDRQTGDKQDKVIHLRFSDHWNTRNRPKTLHLIIKRIHKTLHHIKSHYKTLMRLPHYITLNLPSVTVSSAAH